MTLKIALTIVIIVTIGVLIVLSKNKLLALFAWIKTTVQTLADLRAQLAARDATITEQSAKIDGLTAENAQLRAEAGLVIDPDLAREQDECIALITPLPSDVRSQSVRQP